VPCDKKKVVRASAQDKPKTVVLTFRGLLLPDLPTVLVELREWRSPDLR
jgi:hypothetical protein